MQAGALGKQLVIEVFLRYYDLLSLSESLCLDRKKHKKLRKAIKGSKQKLIFYLSYLKSSRSDGTDCWQVRDLLVDEFVELFANDRMYQKISQSQKEHLKKTLMKSKKLIQETTEEEKSPEPN